MTKTRASPGAELSPTGCTRPVTNGSRTTVVPLRGVQVATAASGNGRGASTFGLASIGSLASPAGASMIGFDG